MKLEGPNQLRTVAAFCGRGKVRTLNEDNVAVDGNFLEHEAIRSYGLEFAQDHLIVVADGMGGHARGELASQLTVQAINEYWLSRRVHFEAIDAARAANQVVYDATEKAGGLRGMGATVVGVHICGQTVAWFNVGDSRGYLYRGNSLEQFTTDHVPRGGTVGRRSRSHSITQSIGGGHRFVDVWPASGRFAAQTDDVLLLCSDGLTDALSDDMICQIIGSGDSATNVVGLLVRAVEENGAPDNVSLALLQL